MSVDKVNIFPASTENINESGSKSDTSQGIDSNFVVSNKSNVTTTSNTAGGSNSENNDSDLEFLYADGEEEDGGASEAYLIYSFTGPKRVQVKTAAFADVPEEGFQNGENSFSGALRGSSASTPSLDRSTCLSQPSTAPSISLPVYGEAFWVGEEDKPLELKPPSPRTLRYASLASTAPLQQQNKRIAGGVVTLSKAGNIILISNNNNNTNIHNSKTSSQALITVVSSSGSKISITSSQPTKAISETTSSTTPATASTNGMAYEVVDLIDSKEEGQSKTPYVPITLVDRPDMVTLKSSGPSNSTQNFISYRARLLNSRTMRCPTCGRHYRNAYSLSHHICSPRKTVWRRGDVACHIIDGQQIYFCPICERPFKWLGNLTRHYYVHTGQRFFKCEMCNKEFFSSYQVKRHMNSHTGLRYKCEICDKPFTCKYACSWHTRQHRTSTNGKGQFSDRDIVHHKTQISNL